MNGFWIAQFALSFLLSGSITWWLLRLPPFKTQAQINAGAGPKVLPVGSDDDHREALDDFERRLRS